MHYVLCDSESETVLTHKDFESFMLYVCFYCSLLQVIHPSIARLLQKLKEISSIEHKLRNGASVFLQY